MEKWLQLLFAVVGIFVVVMLELLDWQGRIEILEIKYPRLWRLVNNRPMRLVLLVLAIGLLSRDFKDIAAVAPPPVVHVTLTAPTSSKGEPSRKASQSQVQRNSQAINAPGGIAVGGGTVNQPTVNNFGPPPLELKASLQPVDSDKQGLIKTEITIVPNESVSAPFGLALELDNPIVSIWFVVENAGATVGGGPYRLGTHALVTVGTGISPSHALIITVYSALPVKLVKPPSIE
jgi:hypothetical protein